MYNPNSSCLASKLCPLVFEVGSFALAALTGNASKQKRESPIHVSQSTSYPSKCSRRSFFENLPTDVFGISSISSNASGSHHCEMVETYISIGCDQHMHTHTHMSTMFPLRPIKFTKQTQHTTQHAVLSLPFSFSPWPSAAPRTRSARRASAPRRPPSSPRTRSAAPSTF